MMKAVRCLVLILVILSLAFTSTSCKTLLAKTKNPTNINPARINPAPTPFREIQSDYFTEQDSLRDLFLSWLYLNTFPLLALIFLILIFTLYRLYRKEKSRQYLRALTHEELSMIQVVKDNVTRLYNSLIAG